MATIDPGGPRTRILPALAAAAVLVGIGLAAWIARAPESSSGEEAVDRATTVTTVGNATGHASVAGQETTATPDMADPADEPEAQPVPAEPVEPPPVLKEEHPPLEDIDGWLQSDVTSLEELRGRVVIVEFWTFGCYNCKNRIPYTQDIYAAYRDQGLEIVGIHSPEFAYEREVENITEAIDRLGVTWPVVLDTDRRIFRAWQGSPAYWPRTYVLDRRGRVRFDHIGEGAYGELEQTVVALLAEPS